MLCAHADVHTTTVRAPVLVSPLSCASVIALQLTPVMSCRQLLLLVLQTSMRVLAPSVTSLNPCSANHVGLSCKSRQSLSLSVSHLGHSHIISPSPLSLVTLLMCVCMCVQTHSPTQHTQLSPPLSFINHAGLASPTQCLIRPLSVTSRTPASVLSMYFRCSDVLCLTTSIVQHCRNELRSEVMSCCYVLSVS